MLVQESHVDIPTSTTPMRLLIFHPVISSGQKARFPAIAVFTKIYEVTAQISLYIYVICITEHAEIFIPNILGIVLF